MIPSADARPHPGRTPWEPMFSERSTGAIHVATWRPQRALGLAATPALHSRSVRCGLHMPGRRPLSGSPIPSSSAGPDAAAWPAPCARPCRARDAPPGVRTVRPSQRRPGSAGILGFAAVPVSFRPACKALRPSKTPPPPRTGRQPPTAPLACGRASRLQPATDPTARLNSTLRLAPGQEVRSWQIRPKACRRFRCS